MSRLTIAAVVAMSIGSASASNGVEVTTDRFTGKRVFSYSAAGEAELGKPRFMMASKDVDDSTHVVITFLHAPEVTRYGQVPKYTDCHTVDWIVDGTPVSLGITTHKVKGYARGAMLEFINQGITDQQIDLFATASKIEYRICADEFQLSTDDLAAFREVSMLLMQPTN